MENKEVVYLVIVELYCLKVGKFAVILKNFLVMLQITLSLFIRNCDILKKNKIIFQHQLVEKMSSKKRGREDLNLLILQ